MGADQKKKIPAWIWVLAAVFVAASFILTVSGFNASRSMRETYTFIALALLVVGMFFVALLYRVTRRINKEELEHPN